MRLEYVIQPISMQKWQIWNFKNKKIIFMNNRNYEVWASTTKSNEIIQQNIHGSVMNFNYNEYLVVFCIWIRFKAFLKT